MYSVNSYRNTCLEFFNLNSIKLSRDLPAYLKKIADGIASPFLNEEYFLYHHTLFPFYTAFNKHERNTIKELMMGENNKSITSIAGLNGSIVSDSLQRHCRECIKKDYDIYGETYWHRIHQIPGVYICPFHKTPLVRIKNDDGRLPPYLFRIANLSEFNENIIQSTTAEVLDMLFVIAVEINFLLNLTEEITDNFKSDIKKLLKLKGYYIDAVKINQLKLQNDFINFYSNDVLDILHSNIPRNTTKNWFSKIFNKDTHPLRFILIIKFLFGGINEYLKGKEDMNRLSEESLPFGEGPWPCLNPVHSDYKKNVINHCEIKKCSHTKKIIGVFKCECGFVYSIKKDKYEKIERYKISHKIAFGQMWEQRLKELVSRKVSLKVLEQELQVKRKTILRYVELLGLSSIWKRDTVRAPKYRNKKDQFEKTLKLKRKLWIQELDKEKAKKNLNLYYWLIKNDKAWLQEHMPKQTRCYKLGSKINWQEEDENILIQVKNLIANWESFEEYRPKRITKNFIAETLGIGKLINKRYLIKVPKTSSYIEQVSESINKYHLRKLEWAYNKLISNNETITKTNLIYMAGLTNRKDRYEFVDKFLRNKF